MNDLGIVILRLSDFLLYGMCLLAARGGGQRMRCVWRGGGGGRPRLQITVSGNRGQKIEYQYGRHHSELLALEMDTAAN